MKTSVIAGALLAGLLLGQSAAAAPTQPQPQGIAWIAARSDADIERALAQAGKQNKPVLLYWGASWCPPCNQLKATLFKRQDFITQTRAVVPVNLDGDLPGAQRLGARFKVRGYPTLILLNPAGEEITRLPGEVDGAQVVELLQLGLANGRGFGAVLADARAGRALNANEWRMLGFYAWESDDGTVAPKERAALLGQLAQAAEPVAPEAALRLRLKALSNSQEGQALPAGAAGQALVLQQLASAQASREQLDVLAFGAARIVRALAPKPGEARDALLAAYEPALRRLQADAGLARVDRLGALLARVELARLDQPADSVRPGLPEPLLQEARAFTAQQDREISDGYERQSVINWAAHVLGRAGLWSDSDALLKANLARSPDSYYLMSHLGGNARAQGLKQQALDWHGQAFAKSQGPATRLQWGASYLSELVQLSPQDGARIERTALQLLDEAAKDRGAFHGRSARSLQRASDELLAWNQGPALKRLRQRSAKLCAGLPADDEGQRKACAALLKPKA
ncbi:thioredoxin family protein [Roseateles sp. DAIF2]|uniref:thioredoxin family protein n=1 Tax=Roseateles sp. DAIF2 TaxID=2714952 RepID=UPI0018A24BE8|nr:thioredoxin fold domain-containing protein [Roseateles sp. DAIF2]QPF75497.1 thioredoxin family protein [Roseateles sp. DAIF2]